MAFRAEPGNSFGAGCRGQQHMRLEVRNFERILHRRMSNSASHAVLNLRGKNARQVTIRMKHQQPLRIRLSPERVAGLLKSCAESVERKPAAEALLNPGSN